MNSATTKDDNEIQHNWNKISSDFHKIGYREGASDGRESVFQKGFDRGYKEGFKNGFVIGKYKAALKIASTGNNIVYSDPSLLNTKKGWCQICDKSSNNAIEEIISHQTTYSNNLLKELKGKYGDICKISLPDNIDT